MPSAVTLTAFIVLGLGVVIFMKVKPLLEVPPVPRTEETWWGPGQPGKNIDLSIRPFKINISDESNEMGKAQKNGIPKDKKLQNQRSKECMQKLRDKIRNDPILHEERKRKERERYYARKAAKKIKTIDQMSEREKRSVRQKWKARSRKSYHKKKRMYQLDELLNENTPPPSPIPEEHVIPQEEQVIFREERRISRQAAIGRLKQRRNREALKNKIRKLEKELSESKRKTEKYRKKAHRMRKKLPDTPNKIVSNLLENQLVTPTVKRKLVFSEVMQQQLESNYRDKKSRSEKRNFVENISGSIIKKYRFKELLGSITSRRLIRTSVQVSKKRQAMVERIKHIVKTFFEEDSISRLCPGRKDTITFRKIKKQKRLLNGTLKNIHEIFKATYPRIKISYQTFCKLRPFWVVHPNARSRDTCLCIIHDNMSLMVSKLKANKIINPTNPDDLMKELCCNSRSEKCLERSCELCRNKEVEILEFEKEEIVTYERWCTKKVEVMIKGEKKMCKKSVKESVDCKKETLVDIFINSIEKFLIHTRNIIHQYSAVDALKKGLRFDQALVHIDFSENYNCKYAAEIQSAHFGGSKPQVSMHTVVLYYKTSTSEMCRPISLCTFCENLRHDPAAICAHLEPILQEMLNLVPALNNAIFLSDGPSTQYKNKKMFYFMVGYIAEYLKIESFRWIYSEPSHGKGAPDGVGGCLKRTADSLVAHGTDIPDFKTLVEQLKGRTGIKCIAINSSKISEIDDLLPLKLKPFKGTMQVRELTWAQQNKNVIQARKLSCLLCLEGEFCEHYGLGTINIPFLQRSSNLEVQNIPSTSSVIYNHSRVRYSEVYSDDDDKVVVSPSTITIHENDYAVIRLLGKKVVKHYVGQVQTVHSNEEYTVKFLQKCGTNKFMFPCKDDISLVLHCEIVRVLPKPSINNREQYYFPDVSFQCYKNLS